MQPSTCSPLLLLASTAWTAAAPRPLVRPTLQRGYTRLPRRCTSELAAVQGAAVQQGRLDELSRDLEEARTHVVESHVPTVESLLNAQCEAAAARLRGQMEADMCALRVEADAAVAELLTEAEA
jgi:hypothetical protein